MPVQAARRVGEHQRAWAEGEGATPDVVKGYLTPENIEKLEAGKLITFEEQKKDQEGKSKGRGVVIGLIDRPVDAVWTIILDCTTHPEYMPRVVKTVLSNSPSLILPYSDAGERQSLMNSHQQSRWINLDLETAAIRHRKCGDVSGLLHY